jgi:predicted O-methyltransferase YrrM
MSLPTCLKPEEFTDWALSREALEWLSEFVVTRKIRTIVECGSGLSTILFASMVREGMVDRVLSLEHDRQWFEYGRYRLAEKGLADAVDLRLCPLRQFPVNRYLVKWYDLQEIAPFPADLILVDGPPGNSWIHARHPAPHLLREFMQPGTWLVLDDYQRQQEREVVEMWLSEVPGLELRGTISVGKGLAVLRWSDRASACT